METSARQQQAASLHHSLPTREGTTAAAIRDNRPPSLTGADLIAAIQRHPSGKATVRVLPARSTSAIVQRLPGHLGIPVADGEITYADLLTILQQVTDEADAAIAARPPTDWYRQFSGLPDSLPAAPDPRTTAAPSPSPLSYAQGDVRWNFQVGRTRLVNLASTNYMEVEGNPAGNKINSYPELYRKLGSGTPAEEITRAQRIRGLLQTGVHFQLPAPTAPPTTPIVPTSLAQTDYEALMTTALFGAETSRSHRTFLTNMMLLDRLEAQQTYGHEGIKTLTLPKLLDTDRGGESKKVALKTKINKAQTAHPDELTRLTDARNAPISIHKGADIGWHGGKGPMTGTWARVMAQSPLPTYDPTQPPAANKINLVHAKEVNVLWHWLRLQLPAGELQTMKKADALILIRSLVQQRMASYNLMDGTPPPAATSPQGKDSSPIPQTSGTPAIGSALPPATIPALLPGTTGIATPPAPTINSTSLNIMIGELGRIAGIVPGFRFDEATPFQHQLRANWDWLREAHRKATLNTHSDKIHTDSRTDDFTATQEIWKSLRSLHNGEVPDLTETPQMPKALTFDETEE